MRSCAAAYTQWLQSSLRFVHAAARRHLGDKLRTQKQYFDRRINKRTFEVGEQVLWLRPHRTKLQNVWQGPYEVVDKASEWHHYTIEREGKCRKATASQLKKFHPSEIGGDIRFAAQREDTNDSEPVSGFFEIESTPEEIPLTAYSGLE
jgi:hypothetical protein